MTLTKASSLKDVVAFVIGYIDLIIPVLLALALVLFMWSGVQYIRKSGESHGKGAEREALLWGVVALFVLFSVWGILRIVCTTLIGTASCQTGTSAGEEVGAPLNILPPGAR